MGDDINSVVSRGRSDKSRVTHSPKHCCNDLLKMNTGSLPGLEEIVLGCLSSLLIESYKLFIVSHLIIIDQDRFSVLAIKDRFDFLQVVVGRANG